MCNVCLNVDILFVVVKACESLEIGPRRRILAPITRTCRAVYECSMDLLWSDLDDVIPLVRCMPARAFRQKCFAMELVSFLLIYYRALAQAMSGRHVEFYLTD